MIAIVSTLGCDISSSYTNTIIPSINYTTINSYFLLDVINRSGTSLSISIPINPSTCSYSFIDWSHILVSVLRKRLSYRSFKSIFTIFIGYLISISSDSYFFLNSHTIRISYSYSFRSCTNIFSTTSIWKSTILEGN